MRRNLPLLFAAAALVTAACSDNSRSMDSATSPAIAPTGPRFTVSALPPTCGTVDESQKTVDTLLPQIFGPGQGRRGTAQGYSNNIVQARRNGDTALEQDYVETLINYTLHNYFDGNLIDVQSPETQTRVLNFFYALYCASGLEIPEGLANIFDAANTVLIRNSTPTTVVSDPLDYAAVKVDSGDVPSTLNGQPLFGTFVSVYETTDPFPTSLDWYGLGGYKQGAFEFVANPPVDFTDPVLTGVCIQYDKEIVDDSTDLRLAHAVDAGYTTDVPGNYVVTTAGGPIEIAALADPTPLGLACDPLVEFPLTRLKRENETLKQERDFLKRAAAFFARESQ